MPTVSSLQLMYRTVRPTIDSIFQIRTNWESMFRDGKRMAGSTFHPFLGAATLSISTPKVSKNKDGQFGALTIRLRLPSISMAAPPLPLNPSDIGVPAPGPVNGPWTPTQVLELAE